MLILVVGPSGAGKDTLLDGARQALREDRGIRFARRVITRASGAGEDHEPATDAEFAARDFALQWQAHGLRYGIPSDIADDLARGLTVVANVSRTVIADAAARFPVRVIEVTAPADLLAARLAMRGREDAAGSALRLARQVALPADVAVWRVVNDGTPEQGVARFIEVLRRARRRAPA
jgi:phosphonate metabolism protein PhnN/1,5-bisphosphokinase (PRPP-forming)